MRVWCLTFLGENIHHGEASSGGEGGHKPDSVEGDLRERRDGDSTDDGNQRHVNFDAMPVANQESAEEKSRNKTQSHDWLCAMTWRHEKVLNAK